MGSYSLNELLPALVFGSLCFVWGSTWLAIKVGLGSLPPLFFAGLRFIIAWGLLLIYALAIRMEFPRDKASWRVMLFLGITQITLPYALVFWGEQYTTAGLAAVLFATVPFFVALFAHFIIPSERLTAWKLSGIIVSFIGVIIIFLRELMVTDNSFWGGVALIVGAGSAGCANVVGKKYSRSIDPTVNVMVQMGVGALLLTVGGILFERDLPLNIGQTSLLAVLYLAVAGSAFAFVALYWLFTRIEVTRVSLFTFITPIVAVVLGWLILGEKIDLNVAVGGSLILAGVILVNQMPIKTHKL